MQTLMWCIVFLFLFFFAFPVFFFFPHIQIKRVNINLKDIPDEKLRQMLPYWRYLLVNQAKALERAEKAFFELVTYFKDSEKVKNLNWVASTNIALTATMGSELLKAMAAQVQLLYKKPRKLKKYLKSHSYNETVQAFFNPKTFYWTMSLLEDTKQRCEAEDFDNVLTHKTITALSEKNDKVFSEFK